MGPNGRIVSSVDFMSWGPTAFYRMGSGLRIAWERGDVYGGGRGDGQCGS